MSELRKGSQCLASCTLERVTSWPGDPKTWLPRGGGVWCLLPLYTRFPIRDSFSCSWKILFLPAFGRGSQRVVMRQGTSERSDEEMFGMGVLPSQRKAPSQVRREQRKAGVHRPLGQRAGHATRQGPTQYPRIHRVMYTVLFEPPCPVPRGLPLETQVLPTMAWYSMFTMLSSTITQDNLTLLLLV